MELPIPELITVISICSTEGCENSNIGIEIQTVKENPMVICGVCGKTTSLVVLPEPQPTIEELEEILPRD